MERVSLKLAFISIIALGGTLGSGLSKAQSGLADAYCQAYMPVVYQAIDLRRDGVPIDIALSVADSAFDTNPSLWHWLRGAVQGAYADPNATLNSLRNGSAMKSCVSTVRGY